MSKKPEISGKVKHDKGSKKYKVEKDKDSEEDITIEVTGDGDYDVQKLSVDGLDKKMKDGTDIHWLNNFSIKKGGHYINEKYYVTIPDLGSSRVVLCGATGDPYYYEGKITDGKTIELKDGDPAVGKT